MIASHEEDQGRIIMKSEMMIGTGERGTIMTDMRMALSKAVFGQTGPREVIGTTDQNGRRMALSREVLVCEQRS
jgi:1,4-dihydroxy-2-naphthoyl-CoA synthase